MSGREAITIAGRVTNAALVELSDNDKIKFAPATHSGALIAIPGVQPGMSIGYGGDTYKIIRAWDDAADHLDRAGPKNRKNLLSPADYKFYTSRAGKFIDLLLVKVGD